MRQLILAALFMLPLSACAQEPPKDAVQSEKERFKVVTLAQGLSHPWSLAFLPDGDYLVSERGGKLLRINGKGEKTEITGLPENISAEGQGGLFDVVLAPDFSTSRRLYLSYAGTDADDLRNTEVAWATLNNNRLDNLTVIFRAEPKTDGGNHYGGRLLFGPDGMLYITLGERFDYRDQAQNVTDNIGTLVRVRPDGRVPADNPFTQDPKAMANIYSYGHRNVQGIALRPGTKEIWTHEHGPRGGDEINILKPGANYGWPLVSLGNHYWGTNIPDESDDASLTPPLHHWTPSIAPSGMTFYTGEKFPGWKDNLFVGALVKEHIRRLEITDGKITHEEELLPGMARIRDVRAGPDGFLYALTDEDDGRLLRLEPAR